MAKIKRVKFLRYFNGPRMILIFQADTVGVVFLSFFATYIALTNASFRISVVVIASFIVSIIVGASFVKTKKNSAKGFLRHWLFVNGIYSPKEDKNKYEEVKRLDVKGYLPEHNDMEFSD